MKIIERYIITNVVNTTLVVMLLLLGVDLFFYIVNEIRFLGQGYYTLDLLFLFMLLKIPTKLYTMFPWSVVLGTLISLGNFAKNSELVAIQVATISMRRIAIFALKGILFLTLLMFLFGEYVSPKSEAYAQTKKTQAMSGGKTIQTEHGMWIRHENEFVHIGTVYSNNKLYNITRYVFDDKKVLKEVTQAKKAMFNDEKWELEDIVGTKFSKDKTEIINKKHAFVEHLLDKEILETTGIKHLERLSLASLYGAIKMRKDNELNAKDYELAFWGKIFRPIMILILAFVVVPFVFGPLRSSSIGVKILTGAIVGFSFHTLNTIFAPLIVVTNLPALFAVILPAAVFLAFGMWGMNRIKG